MVRPMKPRSLSPYLIVDNAAAALSFYPQAFGATLITQHIAEDGERVMHAHFKVGSLEFFVSDFITEIGQDRSAPDKNGKQSAILHWAFDSYIDVDGFLENALDAGCEIIFPFGDMFWGQYYGEIKDPFGHCWSLGSPPKGKDKVNLF